jgi:hypothetical protein
MLEDIKNKIIIDYIRIKLGRYSNKNCNLRFDWDVQKSNNYKINKKIINIFDDFYNNKKIVCNSWKGGAKFIIVKKENYENILWSQLNSDNHYYNNWNDKELLKNFINYEIFIDGDFNGFSTSDIIFELIKICNK